jgi:hypothetical protein
MRGAAEKLDGFGLCGRGWSVSQIDVVMKFLLAKRKG